MRFRKTAVPYFLFLSMIAQTSLAFGDDARAVGTVVIAEGTVYAQSGEIYYTRARVGQELRVNQFGQYKDERPTPAFVKWSQGSRRRLKPYTNQPIFEGEIIQTMGDGFARILFKDDSILDIGPAAIAQVKQFEVDGATRRVFLKTLYGRFRSVVARQLAGPQSYQLSTPSTLMGVRGTEFLVNVSPETNGDTTTEVICLHGQVSVDVAKHTNKGLVYNQPVVVNPGSIFASRGVHGLGQQVELKPVNQNDIRKAVARVSPHVNTNATYVGSSPPPTRLPGTGIKMQWQYAEHKPRATPPVSYFDMEHPPIDRQLASPSQNFEVPREFATAPGANGDLIDHNKFTGAPPISQLPANQSRVEVHINGF